jgi:hypothetical protein
VSLCPLQAAACAWPMQGIMRECNRRGSPLTGVLLLLSAALCRIFDKLIDQRGNLDMRNVTTLIWLNRKDKKMVRNPRVPSVCFLMVHLTSNALRLHQNTRQSSWRVKVLAQPALAASQATALRFS